MEDTTQPPPPQQETELAGDKRKREEESPAAATGDAAAAAAAATSPAASTVEEGISYAAAKKKKGMTVGFVTFENIEQLTNAVEVLKENRSGGKEMKIVDANRRSHQKLRTEGTASGNGAATENSIAAAPADGTSGPEVAIASIRTVRDAVTPLAHMTYKDQLEHKKNSVAQLLKKLTRNAKKACPYGVPLPEWISESKQIGGLSCKLEGILESPVIDGYRNKCEFSVGHSLAGKKTVGFMLGNFREGVTAVEEPVDCPNVSGISSKYAFIFQDFLQLSTLPVWNRVDNSGFWRQFTVREGRSPAQAVVAQDAETQISEVMIIVQVCSTGIDELLMKDEFAKLSMTLVQGAATCSPPLPLTTIVVQVVGIEMNEAAVLDAQRNALINGIKNCSFVCGKAENVMGSLLTEYLGSPQQHLVVSESNSEVGATGKNEDIVDGTKNNGETMDSSMEKNDNGESQQLGDKSDDHLSSSDEINGDLGDRVSKQLEGGHDQSNVANGNQNSEEASSFINEESIATKSADCLEHTKTLGDGSSVSNNDTLAATACQFKNFVAIVDPPRAGLHPTVNTLVANAIELCTPTSENREKNKGHRAWRNMSSAGLARQRTKSMPSSEPFVPKRAMAVDLFPHTSHCEMVMLFER
ncbi:hypothetical protein ACQ4PT_067641 [Festuca glaucescens]